MLGRPPAGSSADSAQTTGRIEANGRTLLRIDGPHGRLRRVLDLRQVQGREVTVRFAVDEPAQQSGTDRREIGLFVHSAALRPTRLASRVVAAELEDGRAELGPGFWPPEAWPDGRSGRWTRGDGLLRLGRTGGESRLAIDLSLQSPRGTTACSFEVNGRRLAELRAGNGRRTEVLDVGGIDAPELSLRIRVERPVVPRLFDPLDRRPHPGRVPPRGAPRTGRHARARTVTAPPQLHARTHPCARLRPLSWLHLLLPPTKTSSEGRMGARRFRIS
jgi:hypothetical protein